MSKERVAIARHIARADRWQPTNSPALRKAPDAIQEWLAWPDSLTEKLATQLHGRVQIRVLSERRDRLMADERAHLAVVVRTARVREVQLEVHETGYVVARTVFPDSTARVMDQALCRLGNRSLGSLLFGAVRAPVRTREFLRLTPQAALWRVLHSSLPSGASHLWARRAVHLLDGEPLLVTEIFLARMFEMAPPNPAGGSFG